MRIGAAGEEGRPSSRLVASYLKEIVKIDDTFGGLCQINLVAIIRNRLKPS